MPTITATETIESIKSKAKYLQECSQCVYDILQIVKTVIDNPGEYKELHFKYHNLINELENKIESDDKLKFKNDEYSIPFDLIFIPFREEEDKKIFYKAERNLKFLLSTIEEERIKLLGEKYKPNTGIKDKKLATMLENIKNRNTPQLLKDEEDDIDDIDDEIQEDEEIKVSKVVTNKYKDLKVENRDKKGRLKITKSGKWINLGGYNTRTYKMTKYIVMPSSKSKLIDDVFEYIKIPKDDKNEELKKNTPRAFSIKKEIIKKSVDELQKGRFLKGHICEPAFNDTDKIVDIIFK